jgi:hypothetical protein
MGSVVHGGVKEARLKADHDGRGAGGAGDSGGGVRRRANACGRQAMAARAAVPSATLRREVPAMPRAEPSVPLLDDVSLRGADEGAGLGYRAWTLRECGAPELRHLPGPDHRPWQVACHTPAVCHARCLVYGIPGSGEPPPAAHRSARGVRHVRSARGGLHKGRVDCGQHVIHVLQPDVWRVADGASIKVGRVPPGVRRGGSVVGR